MVAFHACAVLIACVPALSWKCNRFTPQAAKQHVTMKRKAASGQFRTGREAEEVAARRLDRKSHLVLKPVEQIIASIMQTPAGGRSHQHFLLLFLSVCLSGVSSEL